MATLWGPGSGQWRRWQAVNEALCPVLSRPAPHQLFCGTIVSPPKGRQESIICCGHCWGEEGSQSLGHPPPLQLCIRARAAEAVARKREKPRAFREGTQFPQVPGQCQTHGPQGRPCLHFCPLCCSEAQLHFSPYLAQLAVGGHPCLAWGGAYLAPGFLAFWARGRSRGRSGWGSRGWGSHWGTAG